MNNPSVKYSEVISTGAAPMKLRKLVTTCCEDYDDVLSIGISTEGASPSGSVAVIELNNHHSVCLTLSQLEAVANFLKSGTETSE